MLSANNPFSAHRALFNVMLLFIFSKDPPQNMTDRLYDLEPTSEDTAVEGFNLGVDRFPTTGWATEREQ